MWLLPIPSAITTCLPRRQAYGLIDDVIIRKDTKKEESK